MQDEGGTPLSGADAPGPTPDVRPVRRHATLQVLLAAVAVAVLVVDQLTKAWALRTLEPGDPVDVIGSAIRLNLISNPGAAFSLGTRMTAVLTGFACVVLVVILVVARRLGSRAWAWALGMLLGGALGNLVDRIVRPPGPGRGHVVDFIDYFGWFIGNVADIAIVSAAVLIGYLAFHGYSLDGSHPAGPAPVDGADE